MRAVRQGEALLEYFALGTMIAVALIFFYGIIAIHDIPYEIAKKRNHPHLEALHYAGWVSMFTLHAIWPFLWIWATIYDPKRGYGFSEAAPVRNELATRVEELEQRLKALEATPAAEKEE